MARRLSISNKSFTRVRWKRDLSVNPFSKYPPALWKSYPDVENMIIEEAFIAGKTHAILDDYKIDFKYNLQIRYDDSSKQRPVKRIICNKDDNHIREDRFTFTPVDPNRPFAGMHGWISPFIKEAAKHLRIESDQFPSKDKKTVSMLVEKAAHGIIEEAKLVGKRREGEKLAKLLLEKKNADMKEVWECCARLYSMESFLYKKLNEIMRFIGSRIHEQIWRNKIHTLGPFCLLLWDNPFTYKCTRPGKRLYRGVNLTDKLICTFRDECSNTIKPIRSFPSFNSCSRNRATAENFGNVLLIMTIRHAFTTNLKPFSQYPAEEEELLFPGVCFTINRVDFDNVKNKHVIYLDLLQQHRRTDIHEISNYRSNYLYDYDDARRDRLDLRANRFGNVEDWKD